jgi:hypothetical protein
MKSNTAGRDLVVARRWLRDVRVAVIHPRHLTAVDRLVTKFLRNSQKLIAGTRQFTESEPVLI